MSSSTLTCLVTRYYGSYTNFTARLIEYLITKRNASVTTTIEELYNPMMPGDGVKVFCVSNTLYWDHRSLPKDEALPYLQLSNVLAIRKHCLSMVAQSQLRIATKYLRNEIPALLRDVDLWVESGAGTMDAERKRFVRQTLDALEDRLKRVNKSLKESMYCMD